MNWIWSLFNKDGHDIQRETTHKIVDNVGRWAITQEYAEQGLTEGWLIVVDSRIDEWECEHFLYRLK